MGGRGNRLVPALALAVLALLVFVLSRHGKDDAHTPPPPRQAPAPDADSAADTVRSLAAKLQQIQLETEGLRQENQRLLQQGPAFADKLKSEVAEEIRQQRAGQAQDLSRRLDELSKRGGAVPPPAPVAAASNPPSGPASNNPPALPNVSGAVSLGKANGLAPDLGRLAPGPAPGLVWVQPLDLPAGAASGLSSAVSPSPAPLPVEPPRAKPPEPAYTVPRNATLVGSTAMTALVGRVPVKGQVEDPFPFKVLAGRDNLAANGLDLPEVKGMVFSGTAFGDWTLGCVRGTVKSATFLFEDGTIRTVSADNGPGGMAAGGASPGGGGTAAAGGGVTGKGLGWISDRRGIPCVSGSRISNAADYLSGRMLARGIGSAGQAFARAQSAVNTTPLGGYTSAVTGNATNYALGQTAAGGADELAQWIAERQSQLFDVVYVDTGAEVAVHIDHELAIDYDPQGRRLYHARETASRPVVGGLD